MRSYVKIHAKSILVFCFYFFIYCVSLDWDLVYLMNKGGPRGIFVFKPVLSISRSWMNLFWSMVVTKIFGIPMHFVRSTLLLFCQGSQTFGRADLNLNQTPLLQKCWFSLCQCASRILNFDVLFFFCLHKSVSRTILLMKGSSLFRSFNTWNRAISEFSGVYLVSSSHHR